ncbi:hypothetical protein BC936DRAFT_149347 [Jimgerdemannia flammicorona]|uniref:Uncharacterized protein n=1 Tax=Jimgerdemannia flammicorona TaxID=994334 RepID=A0A433D111_9FUNG|nr:hypothetical protein BC936DRAFT_149347 [Jimgerdemannia flammicorona]
MGAPHDQQGPGPHIRGKMCDYGALRLPIEAHERGEEDDIALGQGVRHVGSVRGDDVHAPTDPRVQTRQEMLRELIGGSVHVDRAEPRGGEVILREDKRRERERTRAEEGHLKNRGGRVGDTEEEVVF